MKSLAANDKWRRLSKYPSNNYCSSIDLNGTNGFGEIEIAPKLQFFCGLNGAGKTTILLALKSILGLELSEQERVKLADNSITGIVHFDNKDYSCQNNNDKELNNQIECNEKIQFYDYFNTLKIYDFICQEKNFDELLDGYDSFPLGQEMVDEIKYLVGKDYSRVDLILIDEYEELGEIPFFQVEENGIEYDARNMGVGEYCLLYCFWKIWNSEDSIIIIEEPESFIAIESQKKLMNIIVTSIAQNHNSFIISTHSPFVLQYANAENIKILSKANGHTVVSNPIDESVSSILGIREEPSGILYVEDDMATDFLKILLKKEKSPVRKNYIIKKAGGSGEITNILNLKSLDNELFSIIGIYDEDQKCEKHDKCKLPYLFLPPKVDVENAMIKLIQSEKYNSEICSKLGIDEQEMVGILSRINGLEKHDWFKCFLELVEMNQYQVLSALYDFWKRDNTEEIVSFLNELEQETQKKVFIM